MIRLVRTELLKLRTTRMWWGLLLGGMGLAALFTSLQIGLAGTDPNLPGLDTDPGVKAVWAASSGMSILALVAGILLLASEYRHQTITTTFLATPRRFAVIAVKMLVGAALGAVYGLVACAVTAAIAIPWLAAKDATGTAPVFEILGGTVLVSAIYGLLGVAVAALIRNQVAAILIALVYTFVVEQLLIGLLDEVGRWLPGGAVAAITQAAPPGIELLEIGPATLLLLGYALVFVAVGSLTSIRRDVT